MNRVFQTVFTASACLLLMLSAVPPASALEKGDWLLRVRAIGISPTDESGGISPDLTTSGLDPQSAIVPELDVTYMVTDTIGME